MSELSAKDIREIANLQATIDRRRAEFSFCANGSRRSAYKPQPPKVETQESDIVEQKKSAETLSLGEYPERVTFYVGMGVRAAQRGAVFGGAWRLYILSKALDKTGYGRIPLSDLRKYSSAAGVSNRSFHRWLKIAVDAGMMDKFNRQSGEIWLYLPGPAKVAKIMGCSRIGRKVEIAARLLVGSGWKAYVWDGAQAAGADGIQMSRKQLAKTYGVSVRTQRYRTSFAGTECQANYANLGIKTSDDHLQGWADNTHHKGLFVAGNGYLYARKPDTRSSRFVLDVGKGRSRKAQAKLRQDQEYSLNMQRVQVNDFEAEFIRLFCNTPKQLEASEKKAERQDIQTVTELYERWYTSGSGSVIWETHRIMEKEFVPFIAAINML